MSEVAKSRPVNLLNFCVGGQVIVLKFIGALTLDRHWDPFS